MYIRAVLLVCLAISAHCRRVPREPFSYGTHVHLNHHHPDRNGIDWIDRHDQYGGGRYGHVSRHHPSTSYEATYAQQQNTRRGYDGIGLMSEADDMKVNKLLCTTLFDLQHSSRCVSGPVSESPTNADMLRLIQKIVSSLSTNERMQLLKLFLSTQNDSLLSKTMSLLMPALEYIDWNEFISILSPALQKTNIVELAKLLMSQSSMDTSDLITFLLPNLNAPGKWLQVKLLANLVEGPLLNVAQDITSRLSGTEWFQLIRYLIPVQDERELIELARDAFAIFSNTDLVQLIEELSPVVKRIEFSRLIGNESLGLDGRSVVRWIKLASPYLSKVDLGNLARSLNRGLQDTDITELLLNLKDLASRIGSITSDDQSKNFIPDSSIRTVYQPCKPNGVWIGSLQEQVQVVLQGLRKPSHLSEFKILAVKQISQGYTVLVSFILDLIVHECFAS
ncbi:hypothetical protein P879_02043 [Paragonimus westermani]|uniref:Vitellogenin domain-containing protein n=1 Tax=Paragonimus westermani TaxID=34504 RepID=A0A8T0DW41_9TREM|nr:hypothetical protein P879_02043 [Paragonimus westermani]